MTRRHATRIDRVAQPSYSALAFEIGDFLEKRHTLLRTRRGRRMRFRSSSVWNAANLLGLAFARLVDFPMGRRHPRGADMRFLARFWPWPFGFGPRAGIVASQPMSKIMHGGDYPLAAAFFYQKTIHADEK